jgi:hypothetical protein
VIAFRPAAAPGALRAGVLVVVTALALLAIRHEPTPLMRGPAPYLRNGNGRWRSSPGARACCPRWRAWRASSAFSPVQRRRRPAPSPRGERRAARLRGLLGLGLQLSLRHLDEEGAVAALVRRTISGSFTSFHRVAVTGVAHDPRSFLAHHHELLPTFRHHGLHAATHPRVRSFSIAASSICAGGRSR